MTREQIEKLPIIVAIMLSGSVTVNVKENIHEQLTEVCNLAVKTLEQEPILDKIRAEVLEEMLSHSGTGEEVIQAYADGLKKGLEFIDKYKAETEQK